jgi:GH25 family lysozyme M1 (1,4-beta-N-acetylmuramidase)
MANLTFTLHNHASSDLTLKSTLHGGSGPVPATDPLPATIAANSTFQSDNLALPVLATYTSGSGTQVTVTLTTTPAGTVWKKPQVAIATPPGSTSGPLEDAVDFDASVDVTGTAAEVNVFDMARFQLTNSSTTDLVLTSFNYTPLRQGDVPARVVPAGQTANFKLRMWPKGFANYVLKDTSWRGSWLLIWWDEFGSATAEIQSPGMRSLNVATDKSTASNLPVMHFTVTSTGASIPVAPSSGKFQMQAPHGNPPGVGISNTQRKVFGIDLSWYNAGSHPSAIDWNKLCSWVDQDERRIWFAIAKATSGTGPDKDFAAYWKAMSKTRIFRGAYHYPYPPATGQAAVATGQAQAKAFINAIRNSGGWRQYDLPPALDLEYGLNPGESLTDEHAYGLMVVMRELISAVSAAFSVAPLLYTNGLYFNRFYGAAKRYYEAQNGQGSWDDALIAPFVSCPKWVFGQWPSQDVDFSTLKMRAPDGFTATWDDSWSMWQWGELAGGTNLRVGPPAGATPPTTARVMGLPGDVDVDVWNGDLDSFAAFASRSRWNP